MNPPAMAGWNLALRFVLEVVAFVALAAAAWAATSGLLRGVAAVLALAAAAVLWTVFNVAGDPSRSGAAPIEVRGWVRLAVELLVLGGGAAALVSLGRPVLAGAFSALVVAQYSTSFDRVRWLLER